MSFKKKTVFSVNMEVRNRFFIFREFDTFRFTKTMSKNHHQVLQALLEFCMTYSTRLGCFLVDT